MEQFYEKITNRLLIESKIDTFSRLIVKKIIQLIIERIQKLEDRKQLVIGIRNLDSTNDEFLLKLTISLKKRNLNRVNVAGSWTPSQNVLEVNVFFETLNGLFDNRLLSQLQQRLYDTVRHEIEHSLQNTIPIDVDDDDNLSSENLWTNLKQVEDYFLSDVEVSAFVAGLYHQAKRSRRSFINVMDDKLIAYKKLALHYNEGNSLKIEKIFKNIKNVWITYAKSRFPEAILSKMH